VKWPPPRRAVPSTLTEVLGWTRESVGEVLWPMRSVQFIVCSSFPSETQPPRNKCGNKKSCPESTFAFKVSSGAANVVGPSICFENTIIMSGVKNNVGRGLNIALLNGEFSETSLWILFSLPDIKLLLDFLKAIKSGTIVIVASYDDPATKLNDEARTLFTNLGSRHASKLAFRDNWIFIGAKGLKDKSPYEQHLQNEAAKNKYEGWPEVLEMEEIASASAS
uniref:FAM3 metabolism regulating signaling molecule D n=1 Tax=Gopherus evgoodei TaxID=1825980 RepID=A0A8C4W6Y7_9SAUR